jgi:hypothetical protein
MRLTPGKASRMMSQLFETLVNHNHPKTEVGLQCMFHVWSVSKPTLPILWP